MKKLKKKRINWKLGNLNEWQEDFEVTAYSSQKRELKMVARKFLVRHENSTFDLDYDTDDGLEVFKFQLFSLTSIPPDEQKIVCDSDSKIISDDSDLISIADKLRLISIDENTVAESSTHDDSGVNEELLKSDEEFARMLQAEEEALLFQQYAAPEGDGQMEQRLAGYIDQVLLYEDPVRQEAARKTVPIDELEEKSLVAIAKKEGNFEPTEVEQDHAFLLELLTWFKQSFSWVHEPPCDSCGSRTISQGMGVPLPAELQYGGSRVELYRCSNCSRITRFPRYNDPLKLLETKKGRCGEWANCFTLYCRAFGYESRLILDFTDHVWTECFSHHLGRWIHLDPCEGIYDNPLLYEKGWNKKLNYVFAIAKDGVYDVTKRYTRKWHEVLTRRNITTEPILCSTLENLSKKCRKDFNLEEISLLEERYRLEKEAMENDLHSKVDIAVSLPGRLSGDKQWRMSRSEFGSGKGGLSTSSCPVRLCVDEHVSNIYDALGLVFSRFVDNSLSVSNGVDALKSLRWILSDFQKRSFRSRKTTKSSHGQHPSLHHALPYFGELLSTLQLKFELDTKNEVIVQLVGHPVKSSLALPVAFDALDDLIQSLAECPSIGKESLSLPLLRLNRLHSGAVLASGEELPFGIATSAFDGLRSSKWEEPNGAKGGFIGYKLKEQKCKLMAYELMSANDAPERDPMGWVVEGSSDGGSSWYVLDRQISQKFDSRFQRKLYRIEPFTPESNAFRFTFLAVRDVNSTSRLQIGNIDLYAVKS